MDGKLYLCLGQEHKPELRPLLKAGIRTADLQQVICEAIALKPELHEFRNKPGQVVRFMNMNGG